MNTTSTGRRDTDVDDALSGLRLHAPRSLARRLVAHWVRVDGPVGPLYVAFTDGGACASQFAVRIDDEPARFADEVRAMLGRPVHAADRPPAGLERAIETGDARRLALDLGTLSDFEQAVLRKTVEIPNGEVRPYGWVAREIGRPRAVRATGTALAHNPIPVIVPCHRVVRTDGVLGNYSGGGPGVKRAILEAEGLDVEGVLGLATGGIALVGSGTTGVVCLPSCHHARRISERHRRPFRSLAQAVSAGFHPCSRCRPGPTTGDVAF